MIIRARTVLPIAGDPIENGAVRVNGDTIVEVDKFKQVLRRSDGKIIDLGEKILLPGLVNAHCHLDYTRLRGKIGRHESFADWIRAINAEKARLNDQDYIESIQTGFLEARKFGTTTVANLTAFPKLIRSIEEPIRTVWFGELIDVRNPEKADQIIDDAVEQLKSTPRWGLAPHAPFTASAGLYSRCEEIAFEENVPLTTHLAESREEMQMFRDGTGAACDFLKSIGRPIDDCGGETPVSRFLRTRKIDERWIIAHLNELDGGDFTLLQNGPKFHIAHCPRSHSFFGHTPFAFERLRAMGFNISLGTDSLASNTDLSLFAEMRELLRKEPGLSPREALETATIQGGRAIHPAAPVGAIQPGALADLIALPDEGAPASVFERTVGFAGSVSWMMLNGEVVTD